MKKDEWIHGWTTGRFENSNKDVITFISDFLYKKTPHVSDGDSSDVIYQLFGCKYCYYFACILKIAFNRGDVCWHKGHGHIVWRDDNGVAYDIGGVFEDYGDGDLIPVETIGTIVDDFKHLPAERVV